VRFSRSRRGAFRAWLSAILLLLPCIPAIAAEPAGEITLTQAVKTALANHPRLAAFAPEAEAADGRILQSSKRPNPELEFEMANTGGNYPPFSHTETTVAYSHPIEWGKRALRVRRSEAEKATTLRDQQRVRLDVISEVMRAFVTLQGAQKKSALAREAESLASSLATVATERVAAGAISPIEETRAKVAFSLSRADVARAARDVESARRELSAAMGEPNASFSSAAGELPEGLDIPDVDALVNRLSGNPDLARWETERASRQAALEVEKSAARPDMTVKGGIKYLRADVATTFLVGFSVPLTLYDRNEGAIREAQAKLSAADLERRDAERLLRSRLRVRHAAMSAAAREAATLKGESLAGAQSAYEAVNEGYRLGKFRYLDVLDAGKMLLETRIRYVDAIVELNLARVDVERLVAQLPGEDLK
jgi:cobalt-zinc-cadmium efflux system outer membrane protein